MTRPFRKDGTRNANDIRTKAFHQSNCNAKRLAGICQSKWVVEVAFNMAIYSRLNSHLCKENGNLVWQFTAIKKSGQRVNCHTKCKFVKVTATQFKDEPHPWASWNISGMIFLTYYSVWSWKGGFMEKNRHWEHRWHLVLSLWSE